MPFYKFIISTKNAPNVASKSSEDELDEGYFVNQRMVSIIGHLSQLTKIAEDVFGSIEAECRGIYERTNRLNTKMQHCQEIVENLNAKAVKVPIGTLSECKQTHLHFKSCSKIDPEIFSSYPRPPAVEKLRDLAEGPSPPEAIRSGMVASEADDFSGTISSSNASSTHIYCKPGTINYEKSRVSLESGDSNSDRKNMSSAVKVSSTVVPIDISGQSFSRMASFRRSLIQVDFLMRRKKKKDKRRNTVTEGDVKELKDALQKMVTDEPQFTLPNDICTYQQIITESKNEYNAKICDDQENEKNSVEQNNNAANVKSSKKDTCTSLIENQVIQEEKSKNALNNEGMKNEPKLSEVESVMRNLTTSKRKAKSHIPISTISAAMNVAVEMRQCNGIKELPVFNGICNGSDCNSSDSDNKLQEEKINSNSSCNEDGSQDESWTGYKKRLQDKCRTITDRNVFGESNLKKKETEVSSSTSSENVDPQDNPASIATSTESDAFFISSDESEEDFTDIVSFKENYGSSTSVNTTSDGSLNSLLSETGTEMTSSTGTLTSIGCELRLALPAPPPPPPMILSATIRNTNIIPKVLDVEFIGKDSDMKGEKKVKTELVLQKQDKKPKSSKSVKMDITDSQRNKTENAKNIFSNLVSFKVHSKDKNKVKNKGSEKKKINKISHQPTFDMYGYNSPKKTKQVQAFIKENVSPVIKNEEKSHMKSFFTNEKSANSLKSYGNEEKCKSKSVVIPPKMTSCTIDQNVSEATKARGIQVIGDIPQKYEHQVTVTPVQRNSDNESKNVYHKGYQIENQQNFRYGNIQRPICINSESQMYTPRIQRPQPPHTLEQPNKSKLAARVILDFDGKVIYSTNSLDRKHHILDHAANMCNGIQNETCDSHFKDRQLINDNIHCCSYQENHGQQNYQPFPDSNYNSNPIYPQGKAIVQGSSQMLNNSNAEESASENEYSVKNKPYAVRQSHTMTCIQSPQSHLSKNMHTFTSKRPDIRPFSFAGNSSATFLSNSSKISVPDPNISGLPVQEIKLTRHNVNLHSKQMEKMVVSTPENSFNRLSHSFYTPPSSFTNKTDILNISPQSTISTEDLFAVIHDCKKRMNIKTDSDISLASSSRSSSPSYIRPSSSRGTLAETGFLSPRGYTHLETSGDRRSWADFRPVKDGTYHERKSLASDRFGPTKPTSMHDFKMLLLQARTNSQISGPRKSAVEMLKVPFNPNKNSLPSLPLNLSARNSIAFSAQNFPAVEHSIHNGHSTVPFKRGNRVRTSLQSRYIMYPPIIEDCSEDTDNYGDLMPDDSATNAIGIKNANDAEHSVWDNSSNNRSIQSDTEYICDSRIKSQQK